MVAFVSLLAILSNYRNLWILHYLFASVNLKFHDNKVGD